MVHRHQRIFLLPLLHPRRSVKGPGPNVFHTLRDVHIPKHQTVPEHLSTDPPDAMRDLYPPPRSPVAAQLFLLFHLKAAVRAVQQQPGRLRQRLRQNIPIALISPCPPLKHCPLKSRTAGKGIFCQADLPLFARQPDIRDPAAVFKGMSPHIYTILKLPLPEALTAFKSICSYDREPAGGKALKLPAAAETEGLHRLCLPTDAFLQLPAVCEHICSQDGHAGKDCFS